MAASFSNHSVLSPHFSVSSLKPSSHTKSSLLRVQFPCQKLRFPKPFSGVSPSNLSFPMNSTKCPNRTTFNASLSAQESARTENIKTPGGNLKAMIRVYKEALLNGDDRVVAEIENRISILENEKNGLEKRVLELSAEITSGKEKYIRLQADFDNYRKRSEKERVTTRSDAQGEVIKSLLLMVDSFERAKQQIKPETDKEKKIDTSYQGIYKQFVEIMRSLQVAVVPTVGKPFDPSLHEAIAREESLEFKEGIITQEFRRGFLLGGRLLRPAMVKVSSGPGSKKASVATDKSSGQPTTPGDDQ
ncbi:putative serine hydroxymethyltransferase [Hibiscus syriacus]|uniref:GrpE protein homolog n=1 Tax=Hibiscus syriacus TaxID=106335 RepID=A0A6A2Y231_HIBSY|nr:protein GrpE-like isoform X2 [Hibiscus syriacus]KAE8669436.1 putative serine hydroxymethyltransferase [Hibiscus syriacus]